MEPPTRRSSVAFLEDTSIPIPHERSETPCSKFILAMGLWAKDCGVSRRQYESLREVLRLFEPHDKISKLPESVTTLRKWTKADTPLLPLREKKIPLLPAKLATMKPSAKVSSTSSDSPLETLVFFDPIELFAKFLSAGPILNKMHLGFAHFVDLLSELWQSNAWASSIRTTSGQFVYFQGQPVFLWISFIILVMTALVPARVANIILAGSLQLARISDLIVLMMVPQVPLFCGFKRFSNSPINPAFKQPYILQWNLWN